MSAAGDVERYAVEYRRARVGEEIHFVPAYTQRTACARVLKGRHFEPLTHQLVAALLARRPGDMVHAGTFFGDMVPSFARACPGLLYAFEPVLENYVLAKLCVEANGLDNVLLTNAGLGERIGVARIDTGDDTHRGGASAISDRGQPTMLTTIDSFDIADLSVLQLDVEGHELAALKGARRSIEAHRPVVLVEDKKRACEELLTGLGYRRAGRLPGIFVYATQDDAPAVRPMVRELRQSEQP